MKKLFNIVIVLCLLICFTACSNSQVEDNTQIDTETQTENDENKSRIKSDLIIEYEHFDDTDFNNNIDTINKYIESNDIKAFDIYDELFNQCKLAFDYSNIACINYDIDYTNDYWAGEYEYTNTLFNGIRNAFLTVGYKLSQSNMAEEFKKHVNNDVLYEYYASYEPLSDEMLKLQNEESMLMSEYLGLDYDDENFYEDAGEIFMELLDVRNKLAEGFGYDNFIEYTDSNLYCRDYTPDELTNFYQAVKDMNYQDVLAVTSIINGAAPQYVVDGQQSLIDLKASIEGVSTYIDEAYKQLKDKNLYWYDDSELNNLTGYTIPLMSNYTPYIFNNLVGAPADLYYQVHELGHFGNYYYCPNDVLMFSDGSYDLCEVHSQGLEVLCIDNINKILGCSDNAYQYKELLWCLDTLIDACVYDEWQRKVYGNPDITYEEVNDIFNEITYEYGINNDKEDLSYQWKDVIHNFTDPGYYISYGTSMYAAIQLYNTSLVDRDLAIKQYNEMLLMDPTIVGYKQAVASADMVLFSDYDNTISILNSICAIITDNVK